MARSLKVEIVGDARSLEKSFARASKATKGFGGDMRQAGRHASRSQRAFGSLRGSVLGLAGGFVGAAGLASAVHAAFSEMADAQKVAAQTGAVIKSTGGIANVGAKHVDTLASSLLNLSGVDDEAIKSGENMLLTFTKIRNQVGKGNDVFDQATKAALDFSVATGRDMTQASLMVGKALNDPLKGLTALGRAGVQFTEGQKKQIKALVASGDTMGAQKIILGELTKEYGGSAKAAGETLPGKLNILKETALNLGGAIAQTLTPSIKKTVDQIVKWLQKSENQKQILDTVKAAVGAVKDVVMVLHGAFKALNTITGSTKRTLELLLGVLVAYKGLKLAGRITNLANSVGLLGTKAGGARGSVMSLRGSLAGKAGLVGGVILAGYYLSKLIRKIPGWESAFRGLGGTIADAFGAGGKMPSQAPPTQAQAGFIRSQARRLRASGFSTEQTAARLSRIHPGFAPSDIRVLSGGIVINGGLHLHGVQNVKQLEGELTKRSKQRPHPRRGP